MYQILKHQHYTVWYIMDVWFIKSTVQYRARGGVNPLLGFNGYKRIAEGRKTFSRSTSLRMYPHTLPESPVRGDHSHTRGYTLAEAVLVPAGHRCPGSTRNMLGAGGECLWSICVLGSSSVIFWKQRVKMSYKPRSPYKPPSKKNHNYFLIFIVAILI